MFFKPFLLYQFLSLNLMITKSLPKPNLLILHPQRNVIYDTIPQNVLHTCKVLYDYNINMS